MKKELGGVITITDIIKAFDTFPHNAIEDSFRVKGVPPFLSKYIQSMYDRCKTIINCKNTEQIPADILRGVK